jgi:hypothetical protein
MALGFSGATALLLMLVASRQPILRATRTLPTPYEAWREADTATLADSQPGEFVP